MEAICKGRLSLEINPDQTEAALSFVADGRGETWTRDKILTLLKKWSVLECVNPVSMEKALQALKAAGDGKIRVVVAEGAAPAVDPDAVRWEANHTPEELTAQAEALLAGAPEPRVYAWRYRKRRVEDKTGKKRPGGEARIVIEPVKEEKPVNPAVRRTGYAAAGALVATIGTAREGTPGRTFRGEPLPAPPPGRPELFYGEGFALEEDKLYARQAGFLRIGENWVDLLPFAAASFSVSLAADGSDCLLSYTPGSESGTPVGADHIIALAEAAGMPRAELIGREAVERIVAGARRDQKPLAGISLCRPVDGLCLLTVSEDKLEARLTLRKGRGRGRPLTLADVSARIKGSGVTQFEAAEVREDIRAFYHDPKQRELKDYTLARGALPAPGEAGTLEWEAAFIPAPERRVILSRFEKQPDAAKLFPSLKEFPLSAVAELAAVAPEGKIARLAPPQRGQPGVDVFGRKLEGAMGKAVAVRTFEHVKKYGMYLVSEIQGYLEFGKTGDELCLRVRPHQDARAAVDISLDGMQAFLSLWPHRGYGEPMSLPKVYAVLREERVAAGLKEKIIAEAVAQAQDGREVIRLLAAEGRPPVHAAGPKLVVKAAPPEEKRVRILADGRADYKSVSRIPVVHVGDLVAEILPPLTRTENGFDVFGKPIFARTKDDAALPQFVNLKQVPGPAGTVSLYAEKEGEFVVTPTAAGVRQMHVIAGDVGFETGNIDFPGSVLVQGSVREGFRVFSKGAITVNDLVEEAVLSAEGEIVIQQGVKGRKSAVIRTRSNIKCLFAENALLMAVGDVSLERSALHCTIKCNGQLVIGKTKGTLMGGIARAKKGMVLVNLGSVGEAKTTVSFGQDYILADQIEGLEKEVEKLKHRALEIDRTMPKLPRARAEDAARLAALRDEKIKLLKAIDQHNLKLFTLRERFEEHYPAAVTVKGTIYPGVVVESHGRHFTVHAETSSVQYTFDPKTGAIEEKPIVYSRRQAALRDQGKLKPRTK